MAFHPHVPTSPDQAAVVEENLHFISNRTMVTSAHMRALSLSHFSFQLRLRVERSKELRRIGSGVPQSTAFRNSLQKLCGRPAFRVSH
jgi:hypothetical protein